MINVTGEARFLDAARLLRQAAWSAVKKLNPLTLIRNPVMFVVAIVAILATLPVLADMLDGRPHAAAQVRITLWLWITVLAGNFAEAVAECRCKARADVLRATQARRQPSTRGADPRGGDIAMAEGAMRRKTPSETALTILLIGQTVLFLIVAATLGPFMRYSGADVPAITLLALAVTLIPTTIGALLSVIGIAGMERLMIANVIAKSGGAVEACGDVDTLLIDKTGTITFGNRVADSFKPLPGVQMRELCEAAYLASFGDATTEGKSIVELARRCHGGLVAVPEIIRAIAFSAQTRISGADLHPKGEVRKGAEDAIRAYATPGDNYQLTRIVHDIARTGGTPIVVARDSRILGVIHLKDAIKPAIRERFQQLRKMGVRSVMITGDNALTAAAIAAQAGVDDVLAEATPEKKLALIRKLQAEGRVVAMCGDGSNDAPALTQADVGMAMNDGAQGAKDAADLVDLDNDPTKLVDVVRIGKQLLISRGALTTFSMTGDVAKYFIILPPLFATVYPGLAALNVMGLHSPQSAILAAVMFNALIILALIPLALRGVDYEPSSAEAMLGRNLLIYGLGGLAAPCLGIKAIDMVITALGWV